MWDDMGSPAYPSKSQLAKIEAVAHFEFSNMVVSQGNDEQTVELLLKLEAVVVFK